MNKQHCLQVNHRTEWAMASSSQTVELQEANREQYSATATFYWFVVWNMASIFPYIGNNRPN